MKIASDTKVGEMEEESQKQKMKIRELQNKLETAMNEIRKNQNLAVPKSPRKTSNMTNTDSNSISVQDSTTFARTAEKDTLPLPIKRDSSSSSFNSSSKSLSPCTSSVNRSKSDKYIIIVKHLETLLELIKPKDKTDKIIGEIQQLLKEHQKQDQIILKLKSEQMKACEIIKTMMGTRNKGDSENNYLKERIKQLEHELESVVTKPSSDGDTKVSLKQKVTDMNIKAVNHMVKSEDEVAIRKRVSDKLKIKPSRSSCDKNTCPRYRK